MNICPLCNGLRNIYIVCQNCGNQLEDMGKLTDFFGDYSPYMDIDLMKMIDGYDLSYTKHQCPHLFYCHQCGKYDVRLITE